MILTASVAFWSNMTTMNDIASYLQTNRKYNFNTVKLSKNVVDDN